MCVCVCVCLRWGSPASLTTSPTRGSKMTRCPPAKKSSRCTSAKRKSRCGGASACCVTIATICSASSGSATRSRSTGPRKVRKVWCPSRREKTTSDLSAWDNM
ncbi:hypothetical protein EYF80_066969 [Liparis tanakae]|uniref:Uncharacterized protein n=1 Tax=Liparis tanakae TaxID=230148 RepID=A0A4Z2E2A6_9TELE|nr:hypothetical protein EYF80_066969 [Liparis tanakae]